MYIYRKEDCREKIEISVSMVTVMSVMAHEQLKRVGAWCYGVISSNHTLSH